MKLERRQLSFTGIWALFVAVLLPLQAKAIVLLPPCTKTGNCGISDILIVLVNGAEFLLGISGAVALLFFVYGGFTMLTSAGKSEQVEKGKTILRNAVIGIAIIFLSGVIVRFTTQALTGGFSGIPTVGESCIPGSTPAGDVSAVPSRNSCTRTDSSRCKQGEVCVITNERTGAGVCQGGIWVSIPAGQDATDKTKVLPETVMCVSKDDCADLNSILAERGRTEVYTCVPVDSPDAVSCVRGLCPTQPASHACCITGTRSDDEAGPARTGPRD